MFDKLKNKLNIGGSDSFNLEMEIYRFYGHEETPWKLRNAVEGTQIFGASGSGKSSSSGKEIAKAFLKAKFGGLVLCAKPGERKEWERYAKEIGVHDRLIIFNEKSGLYFNPLAYEAERNEGGGETINLVDLLMKLYELGQNFGSSSGSGDNEKFWLNALNRLISRLIDLLILADEEVSIENLKQLLDDAFTTANVDQRRDPLDRIKQLNKDISELNWVIAEAKKENDEQNIKEAEEEIKKRLETRKDYGKIYFEFVQENYCAWCLNMASEKMQKITDEKEYEAAQDVYKIVEYYFEKEFTALPEKTRATVAEYLLGIIEPFRTGILKKTLFFW